MQKALCCLGDVPYCFSRLSVKFQGHTAQNASILTKIGRFRTVTPVWINLWLQNDAQRLKQHRRGALILFKVIRQNFKVTGGKIGDVDPIWGFLDCNWSLNSLMALKLWTKLNVVYKRCLIIFYSHLSNFKVTQDKKFTDFYPNRAFPDCSSSLNSVMVL